MMDNLISDLIKQIWTNLELYFKSYEFSDFKRFLKNFSDFFMNLIRFLLN